MNNVTIKVLPNSDNALRDCTEGKTYEAKRYDAGEYIPLIDDIANVAPCYVFFDDANDSVLTLPNMSGRFLEEVGEPTPLQGGSKPVQVQVKLVDTEQARVVGRGLNVGVGVYVAERFDEGTVVIHNEPNVAPFATMTTAGHAPVYRFKGDDGVVNTWHSQGKAKLLTEVI